MTGHIMRAATLISLCVMEIGCSTGATDRSEAERAAFKTCNSILRPRMDSKPVNIPEKAVSFEHRGRELIVRWPFKDGTDIKTGVCKTSLDGKIFRSAEARQTK